jgi:ketosteroid isomerase-like protein
MHPNERLIRDYYEAREQGNLGAVRSKMADDIAWHDPYPEPYGGDLTGADTVLGQVFAAGQASGATFTVHDVLASDEHAVALVEWSATVSGETLDGREVAVYHVRRGLITEAWFYPEDPARYAEFFSRG